MHLQNEQHIKRKSKVEHFQFASSIIEMRLKHEKHKSAVVHVVFNSTFNEWVKNTC